VGVHVAFVGMGVVILARPEVAGTAYTFSGIRVIPYNEIQPPRHCNTAEPSALNRVVLIWMCSVVFRYSLLKTPAQGQLGREICFRTTVIAMPGFRREREEKRSDQHSQQDYILPINVNDSIYRMEGYKLFDDTKFILRGNSQTE
jgi:hypothetical protein